ncbi:MAG: hypothetical protein JKY92_08230 [Magnetovibrio sp.]|nr:hypothetical protein [Magnetovibrio sp.]
MTDKSKTQDKSIAKEILDKAVDLMEAVDGAGDLRVGQQRTSKKKNEGSSGTTNKNTTNGNDNLKNKDKE